MVSRASLLLGFHLLSVASYAENATIRFVPTEESPLLPAFHVHCVPYLEYVGLSTGLPSFSKDLLVPWSQTVCNAMVQKERGSYADKSLYFYEKDGAVNDCLNTTFPYRGQYELAQRAGRLGFIAVLKFVDSTQPGTIGNGIFMRLGPRSQWGALKDIPTWFLTCRAPKNFTLKHFDMKMVISGTASPNPYSAVFRHPAYLAADRVFVPLIFLYTSLTAGYYLFRIQTETAAIEKTCRTIICKLLLSLEATWCFLLAVQLGVFGSYNGRNIRIGAAMFFLSFHNGVSLGTTFLAGAFWYDRRNGLLKRLNALSVGLREQAPLIVRSRIFLIAIVAFFLCFDLLNGFLALFRPPNYDKIISGFVALVSICLGVFYLRESLRFRSVVKLVRANSQTAEDTQGLNNLSHLSRWFMLGAVVLLFFVATLAFVVIFGSAFWSPLGQAIWWPVHRLSRALISFTQVMLCRPALRKRVKKILPSGEAKSTFLSDTTSREQLCAK